MGAHDITDLLAAGIRMEHGRHRTDHTITMKEIHGLDMDGYSVVSNVWQDVWRTTLRALVAVAGGDGGMLYPAEVERLRALVAEENPPILATLEGYGSRLARFIGISDSLPQWEAQTGYMHGIGPAEVRDLGLVSKTGEEVLAEVAAELRAILREIGAEGARLAEKLPGLDLSIWLPMEPEELAEELAGDLAGARLVALGALRMNGRPAPVRIVGPDPATCQALRYLALAVWRDLFGGAELVKRAGKALAPSIPQELAQQSMFPLQRVDRVESRGGGVLVAVAGRSEYALVTAGIRPDIIDVLRWLARAETWYPAVADRLLRHIITRCAGIYLSGAGPDTLTVPMLKYEGGWSKLAKEAGISEKHRGELPRVVALLRAWKGVDGLQPALIMEYTLSGGHRGERALLTILVGEPLFPGSTYIHRIQKGPGRRLLPVLARPETAIPGVSGEKTSNMLLYHWLIVAALRDSAGAGRLVETSEGPAILLPKAARRAAAKEAGLSASEGEAVDRVWIGGGAGSWLTEPDQEGGLRTRDGAAMRLLLDASELSEKARKAAAIRRKKVGR